MPSPADRKYSDSHEWHKLDGDVLTLGVTQHAVDELTDITYVELKPSGTKISAGGAVGVVAAAGQQEVFELVEGDDDGDVQPLEDAHQGLEQGEHEVLSARADLEVELGEAVGPVRRDAVPTGRNPDPGGGGIIPATRWLDGYRLA